MGEDPADPDPDPECIRLAAGVREAEAQFEQSLVDSLIAIGRDPKHNGGPRALEFVLSRRFHDRWAERKELAVAMTTTDGNPPISLAQFRTLMTPELVAENPETIDALEDGNSGD